jgi:2-polyprenyl-3-methyl-5-hydroxy-6-metoxy-1,4-benzoquinol methylase
LSIGSRLPIDQQFEETPYGIRKRLQAIEDWLPLGQQALRILDFGCGTGEHVTFPLAQIGHHVIGVDMHPPSIDLAQKRYDLPNLEFKVATAAGFSRQEEQFDVVVCSEVLEHLHDPIQLLTHFHRILKESGRLIITTPNGRGSYEILCAIERQLRKTGIHQLVQRMAETQTPSESAGFLNFDSRHIQFFRLRELERIFRDSGFKIVSRRPRTLFCGPYVDLLFKWLPFHRSLIRLNARIPDMLPMQAAADWMFLLSKA